MIITPDATTPPTARPECKQCGTCCRRGGPALHRQDGDLLSEGLLRPADLCAFRAGELVRDDAEGTVKPLPRELVKIAPPEGSRPDDWTCRFLTSKNTCFLYGRHPAECRALFCQAPEALLTMSGEDRLDRKAACELFQAPPWWSELMEAHQEKCDYATLTELAARLDADEDARAAFLEIVEYDRAFRELVTEKKAARPEDLDFLFGRPLLRTIIMYGLDARPAPDGGILLVQTSKPAAAQQTFRPVATADHQPA